MYTHTPVTFGGHIWWSHLVVTFGGHIWWSHDSPRSHGGHMVMVFLVLVSCSVRSWCRDHGEVLFLIRSCQRCETYWLASLVQWTCTVCCYV